MSFNNRLSVLVVEDNPGDFAIVEELLTEQPTACVIEHAASFKQVQAALSPAANPDFDVILLDLTLPDKRGQELVREMLELASMRPIIILTGYEDLQFSITSISLGISDYLVKDDLNPAVLFKSMLYSIERQKILAELKDTQQRYSDLFHLSPQPMYVFNPADLRFQQVNQAALGLYGYTEQEFLNMRLSDIRLVDDLLDANAVRRQLSHGEGHFTDTVQQRKQSGEIIEVEIHSVPLLVNGELLRSVVVVDVTERNRFEITLSKAIIKAQEDERYEVGSELHDNVCQILAASNLGFAMIKDAVPDAAQPLFVQSRNAILQASKEIRKLSHRLAPAFYESRTLREEFAALLHTFNLESRYDINLLFDAAVSEQDLSMDVKISLYRILQEQLNNICKYSEGTRITVQLQAKDGRVQMTVSDNGVGCDLTTRGQGIGLANMKRRALLCSGKFEALSAPGQGYTIRVDLPAPCAVGGPPA